MKKICILSSVNIRHMSMISIYTEKLKKDGIKYDIVYMDKYGEEEFFDSENKYVFTNIVNKNDKKIIKVKKYFEFKSFAIPILEANNYDFIIVWSDNASFIFADYLSRKWKGKYCLNVRDYFSQKNKIVYYRFKKVIKNSAFTTISSEAYKHFLPPHDYIHIHSLNETVLSKANVKLELQKNNSIRIVFLGYVRFLEINKQLLNVFKNDNRFELHYYGTHSDYLKKYAEKNNIYNAYFGDTFEVADTHKFINQADLINNLYGNGNMSVDYALSIKLYYGLYTKTPILVSPNTHMEEIINKHSVGFVIDEIDEKMKDKLFEWYNDFNFKRFSKKCDQYLETIAEENKLFDEYYNQYIKR